MRRLSLICAASCCYFLLACGTVMPTFGNTVIPGSEGGDVGEFADLVASTPGPIKITGNCWSSCTMFLARRDLCVTPNVVFAFHQAHWPGWFHSKIPSPDGNAILMAHYPARVRALLAAQGGLPLYGHIFIPGPRIAKVCK